MSYKYDISSVCKPFNQEDLKLIDENAKKIISDFLKEILKLNTFNRDNFRILMQ